MTAKTCEITKYVFTSRDNLLLDANIWLLLYGPNSPKDRRTPVYSMAYHNIMTAKSKIYIDVLIVSEFINAWARICNKILAPEKTFKDFRRTSDFKSVAKDISLAVEKINKVTKKIDDGFGSLDLDKITKDYSKGNSDFNDQILAELCKNKGMILVTDDGDFKNSGIPLITANRRLII